MSNTVSGFNINYDGIAHKFNNKIQIATPDPGPGYAAASNYHLIFEKNTGASEALMKKVMRIDICDMKLDILIKIKIISEMD